MALQPDFKDIVIRWPGHPKYIDRNYIIENELIEVIVQKLEMVLFSNKGDVIGDEDMGCNLEYYLWSTTIPNESLRKIVIDQIVKYIPELYTIGFDFVLNIFEGTVQDILVLDFTIKGYNVNFVFS
jgi:hypothetical protein